MIFQYLKIIICIIILILILSLLCSLDNTNTNTNTYSISINNKKNIEHFTSNQPKTFKKCKQKNEGSILKNIFKDENIQRETNKDWDLYIPCGYNKVEKELQSLQPNKKEQKIFGINGCDLIVSKNNLWHLLQKAYGREIAKTIMPETYILSKIEDIQLFRKRYNPEHIYILKKNIQNKKGIHLTKDIDEIELAKYDKYKIVQEYITNVFLINKRKINLRMYLLFVCENNITDAYLYKEGKCIYTNKDYNTDDITDKESNITSINLNQEIYNDNPFSFEELKIFLNSRNYNSELLFQRIRQHLVKLYNAVKDNLCNLENLKKNVSFQLFGVDVIFDNELKPYILEINKGPEMKPKNNRDKDMKLKLNKDMLNIVGLIDSHQEENLFVKL